MSDLGVPGATTVSCPVCGNQADAADAFCSRCGASLDAATSEGDHPEQLELIDAERAAAAAGFDADAEVVDHHALCPTCGLANPLWQRVGSGRSARDTPTGRDDLEVLTLRCERCDTAMRVTVDRSELTADDQGRDEAAAVDRPVSHASFADEVDRFEPAAPGTLADQRELLDEQGDDIRRYTGEPVETEAGWVLPQQQNFAGRDNIAGGGEWPDPHAEPAQPSPASDGGGDDGGGDDDEHGGST